MGGFTSAGPVLAARRLGVPVCLHESNTVPGRANRLLSRLTEEAFVGFSSASSRLGARNVHVTGTPVRESFRPADAAGCRQALGFRPEDPVVLVVGGSQGASGLNNLVSALLPQVCAKLPKVQWLHLAGPNDEQALTGAYSKLKASFRVHRFFDRMDIALGAATCAVSRAGASALAELAAVQVPAVLVPYPHAANNHQLHNARAFEASGAAILLEEHGATPERLAGMLIRLLGSEVELEMMRQSLVGWHRPNAAREIVDRMLKMAASSTNSSRLDSQPSPLRRRESMVA
jgi:UDP-N-acetylglucosamine--N-acetylmuramyl-(pentapeptide) pyrophosphoryl-undecaprenol N-acetylglucosamine transferase